MSREQFNNWLNNFLSKFDLMQYAVGLTIILSFLAIEYVVLFGTIPNDRESFAHLRGMIDMAFVSSLVGYYYGKSKTENKDPR